MIICESQRKSQEGGFCFEGSISLLQLQQCLFSKLKVEINKDIHLFLKRGADLKTKKVKN